MTNQNKSIRKEHNNYKYCKKVKKNSSQDSKISFSQIITLLNLVTYNIIEVFYKAANYILKSQVQEDRY